MINIIKKQTDIDTGISDKLLEGEEILWTGKPHFRLFNGSDLFLVPFTLLWGGFSVYLEIKALPVGSLIYQLYWLFFAAAGLYLIFGRFIYKYYVVKNTFYFVTNKRVVVLKRIKEEKLIDISINKIPSIIKYNYKHGIGTLRFGTTPGILRFYEDIGLNFIVGLYRKSGYVPAFHNISHVEDVYQLVEAMRTKT